MPQLVQTGLFPVDDTYDISGEFEHVVVPHGHTVRPEVVRHGVNPWKRIPGDRKNPSSLALIIHR